jgi:hypothetical protein
LIVVPDGLQPPPPGKRTRTDKRTRTEKCV